MRLTENENQNGRYKSNCINISLNMNGLNNLIKRQRWTEWIKKT